VVNQLVKAGVIDDVFSLCFGMVEGDGVLLLGDAEVPGTIPLQYTPLLSSASHPFYYNVKMLSIAIDGQLLAVPQALFDQGYGTVLDSGTTFTYLPTPAFRLFSSAVEKYALGKGLKKVAGPDPKYEDICFGEAPHHQDLEGLSKVFPSMELQFDQVRGGRMAPAPTFPGSRDQPCQIGCSIPPAFLPAGNISGSWPAQLLVRAYFQQRQILPGRFRQWTRRHPAWRHHVPECACALRPCQPPCWVWASALQRAGRNAAPALLRFCRGRIWRADRCGSCCRWRLLNGAHAPAAGNMGD
jgi:hypothetical protein